jgi:hypothetical protein
VRFGNGAQGVITASGLTPGGYGMQILVVGAQGALRLDNRDQLWGMRGAAYPDGEWEPIRPRHAPANLEGMPNTGSFAVGTLYLAQTLAMSLPMGETMIAKRPASTIAASTELNMLCTPQVQWCEGMKAEFEKAHPDITVNFVRMSSGESLTRLRNEKDNPQFDIWWGGPIDSFVAAKAEGLLEPYDSPNLANLITRT